MKSGEYNPPNVVLAETPIFTEDTHDAAWDLLVQAARVRGLESMVAHPYMKRAFCAGWEACRNEMSRAETELLGS